MKTISLLNIFSAFVLPYWKKALVAVLLVGAVIGSRQVLQYEQLADSARPYQPIYLPEVKYVRLVTLGYESMVGDLLWFNTLNYFGAQYSGEKDYRWFKHMCNLVTELDPRAEHTVEFCSTLLAWVVKDVASSNEFLSKGIAAHPDKWRFYYLRGFNKWYFEEDFVAARNDFVQASKLPDAPPFLASIASRLITNTASASDAIIFLSEAMRRSNNQGVKTALEDEKKRALLTLHLEALNRAYLEFKNRYQRKPESINELLLNRLISEIPKEPFGGRYYIDTATENVKTDSGQAPLQFKGKTQKTSSFANGK